MPFSSMMRRFSSRLLDLEEVASDGLSVGDCTPCVPGEGDTVFCKNNVCVHPPSSVSAHVEHVKGYLSIKAHSDQVGGNTLLLSWIPNSQLEQSPAAVSSLTPGAAPLHIPMTRRQKRASRTKSLSMELNSVGSPKPFTNTQPSSPNSFLQRVASDGMFESIKGVFSNPGSRANSRPESPVENIANAFPDQIRTVRRISRADSSSSSDNEEIRIQREEKKNAKEDLQALLKDINAFCLTQTPSAQEPHQNGIGDGNHQRSNNKVNSLSSEFNQSYPWTQVRYSTGLAEGKSNRDILSCSFSADLSQMRSVRMFFVDSNNTCGQLVIASLESHYKILHFHSGGLDKLANVLKEWRGCTERNVVPQKEGVPLSFDFSVSSLNLPPQICYADENKHGVVTPDMWNLYVNEDGCIEDDVLLRKQIFFGGIDPSLRAAIWPFLLHYMSFKLTHQERLEIRHKKEAAYAEITVKRSQMKGDIKETFWRQVQTIIDKDVVRTDRCNPFFRGESNPNLQIMRNILLNYAVYNPIVGYMQGMSDLVAPLLSEIKHEADTFWCFVGLMHATIFISSPTDEDMEMQLMYVRELLRVFAPQFYAHLKTLDEDALELLFCHRWILLCFKREFVEADALRIWEACWAQYDTTYFHIFICVAIVKLYGADVVERRLAADDILLHFSNLAMHMSCSLVLKMARSLLFQFKSKMRIPCTLHSLHQICDRSSRRQPVRVLCTGHGPERPLCPFIKGRHPTHSDYARKY